MPQTHTGLGSVMLFATLLLFSCEKREFMPNEADIKPNEGLERSVGIYLKNADFYALTKNNMLVKFSGNQIFQEEDEVAITGLQTAETVLAIDFRPGTGQLYGVTNQSRLYIINQLTGMAVAVSSTPFTPAISGTQVGFDFNPTVDRIRLVTNDNQNLRLNPETGAVVFTDGIIKPGNPDVVAVAYTNNFAGSTTTTLYDIDVATDKLYIQNPPNDGTLTEVGSLKIDADGEAGFDIAAENNLALAILNVKRGKGSNNKFGEQEVDNKLPGATGKLFNIYTINLQTGQAKIAGTSNKDLIGLAIPTAPVAYSVSGGNALLIFDPFSSATPITKPITGLQMNETVLGIDMRPVNGQLYALTNSRVYTINTSNGAATIVGTGFSPALTGTQFGVDFNPTVDRIRVVSNTGENIRLHPTLGTIAFTDLNLNPGTPAIDGAAYTNNFAGALTTVLYDIDYNANTLIIQNPPNSGTLVPVGSLGVNIDAGNGFDIGGTSGLAYAILRTGSGAGIYSVNLTTGKAKKMKNFTAAANGFALGTGF